MLLKNIIIFLCLHLPNSETASSTTNTIKHHPTRRSVLKTTNKSTIPVTPKKIVGGHQCGVEKYPFMVSLRRLSTLSHFCAGSLIRPDWIITAAHCVAPHAHEPNLFTAIAGISQFNQLGIQRIRVKQIFVHPEFDENNFDNDIALISLEHNFVLTELVQPITIPNHVIHEDLYAICPEGTSIGWGWHSESKVRHLENGSIPHLPVMQCVINLPLMSERQCLNARAGLHLRPNTFCAMVQTRENLCQGDSGGPLFRNNVQYGIVSSGYTCNFANDTPGYYTRIDRVLSFIKECLSGQVSYSKNIIREVEEVGDGSLVIKHNDFLCIFSLFLYFQL
ncbi:trypsin-like [Coccinella septempunctata]|uniref:trypsin-like n=1 Tax=Coccinella septempunctata TaxID=41139 RepID=UPI001D0716BF|nr:trypsin-like [Coccinella septempunctata]